MHYNKLSIIASSFGRKKLDKAGFIQFLPFCPEETGFGRKKLNPGLEGQQGFLLWAPSARAAGKTTGAGRQGSLVHNMDRSQFYLAFGHFA